MNFVFSYLNQLFNHDDRADGRGLLDHRPYDRGAYRTET